MADKRTLPPREASERATLTAFLDFQRATLALKCEGLTDAQLRERALPPSKLSLLGLIRHMAEVERNWFRPVLGGEEMSGLWTAGTLLDPEPAFENVDIADRAASFDAWHDECEYAAALTAAAVSLEVTGVRGGARFSLRWVLVHMIEEYARHNGHADLLRERLDGATGQ